VELDLEVSAFGHYIKKHDRTHSECKHCLAGGARRCNSPIEFVLGFTYTKIVHTSLGDRSIEIHTRKPACYWHGKRFAKKNNLHLPV
jgi:hypothetical protein